ncbi:hypothetical protein [Wolbachia endosymbiont of Scaptomyza pallida]|uniref:hypothetical protein n=1 Tax=Wolbachia endosymbiont of Scaptomyza pallida TaxID=375923 RepID=UPI002909682F|nr:hypothetical protein [Wolbachia endosymbiont of Scaptomyza pallida]MDU8922060.1 hypothetical protein [Wolbachia endosymbiont of Scaptomyza pallida]
MNISTIDNTLQNYITKYIEQTFATHVLGNRYDKLYRKLLSGIEEIIKLAVNEAKHYDENLEDLYNDSRFNKKFIQAVAKHQVSEFLNTYPKRKEIVAEFYNEHHINENAFHRKTQVRTFKITLAKYGKIYNLWIVYFILTPGTL